MLDVHRDHYSEWITKVHVYQGIQVTAGMKGY